MRPKSGRTLHSKIEAEKLAVEKTPLNVVQLIHDVESIIKPLANSAAQIGDEDFLSLWAGQSASMSQNMPAKDLMEKLIKEVSSVFKNIENN